MKTLSVIVPVYNSEKYLQRCIDSILSSTYQDIELILVDDGSKDSSPQICDDNAERDERIKVIHQENAGISQARNNRIKLATGYYLALVDNDDYIDPTMYEKLIKCIEDNDVDYAECGVNLVYPDKTFCDNEYAHKVFVFDTKKALEMFDGDVIRKEFDIPDNLVPTVLLPIGYKAKLCPPSPLHKIRKDLDKIVEYK